MTRRQSIVDALEGQSIADLFERLGALERDVLMRPEQIVENRYAFADIALRLGAVIGRAQINAQHDKVTWRWIDSASLRFRRLEEALRR